MTTQEIELARANGVLNKLYEQEVVNRIRQRYSLNQELAILRQKETKPDEFNEYYNFVESIKSQVKTEIGEL